MKCFWVRGSCRSSDDLMIVYVDQIFSKPASKGKRTSGSLLCIELRLLPPFFVIQVLVYIPWIVAALLTPSSVLTFLEVLALTTLAPQRATDSGHRRIIAVERSMYPCVISGAVALSLLATRVAIFAIDYPFLVADSLGGALVGHCLVTDQ